MANRQQFNSADVQKNVITQNQTFLNTSYKRFEEENPTLFLEATHNPFRDRAQKMANSMKRVLQAGTLIEYEIFRAYRRSSRDLFAAYKQNMLVSLSNGHELTGFLAEDEALFEAHWELSKLQLKFNFQLFKEKLEDEKK